MRAREEIAKNILNLEGDLEELRKELAYYPWDLELPVISVTANEVLNAVVKTIKEEITPGKLEEWANLIESRDDFGFQNDKLQEIIFQLANPEINGRLKKEQLIKISDQLTYSVQSTKISNNKSTI